MGVMNRRISMDYESPSPSSPPTRGGEGSDLAVLAHSGKDEYEMFHLLTEGDFAPLFLGVELILGGLIPLILLSIKRIRLQPLGQCAACALILCGILAMRIVIVIGGQTVRLF